jgi:hypothetical protein
MMGIRQVQEYIKILERREEFLQERIGDREKEKSHYDRAEKAAIEWAIRYLQDTIVAAGDHQYKWATEGWGKDEYDELS